MEGLSDLPTLQTLTLDNVDRLKSLDGLSGVPALQTLTLENLELLRSLKALSGVPALQTLTLVGHLGRPPVPQVALMPDLSSLTDLEIIVWQRGAS